MKILLATDGSQYAEEAAWLLAHLPHREPMELTVLYISNVPNLHGARDVEELTKMLAVAEKKRADNIISHLKRLFEGANATLDFVVGTGQIGTQIIRTAESRDSDLIVLGALGHSLLERLFGSTSDFVATHAKCSVLVVRPTGLKASKRPIDISIAYDEPEISSTIFEQLSQFGWGANTKMELVNIISIPFNYTEIAVPFDLDKIIETRKQELSAAECRFRELSPVVETHVLEANHVGDGLVRFAKTARSDLIVLGNTGGGLLRSFLLGSVSKYVLRHAECSVWIVRRSVG